jgi:staphylococcal nuclease domain-containing protein 1
MLVAAEAVAKQAKKGVHSDAEYKKPSIVDLTDPKKAKAYSGSLIRAGVLKATVELVLNGSRFKLFIPSENCEIIFALENIRCPQPSFAANPVTKVQGKTNASTLIKSFSFLYVLTVLLHM